MAPRARRGAIVGERKRCSGALPLHRSALHTSDSLHQPPDNDRLREQEWVAAAQRDPQAFAPLYERYHKLIFLFILKRVGDRDRAGDLTSQVFLKAMLALSRYQDKGVPFKAWLYRIALNEVLMHYRSRKGRIFMDVERADVVQLSTEIEAAGEGGAVSDIDRLTRALSRLRPVQCLLIELHWFDGLSYAEVGQVLGIAEAAAKMRTHRIVRLLRQYLSTAS